MASVLSGSIASPQFVLHRQLQDRGLWLPDSRHEAILFQCKARGKLLKREVLKKILNPADYEYVNSADAFGLESRRIRRSLASVLSFGFHLGSGFAGWLRVEQRLHADIATTCAIFSLMTMLFDRCMDDLQNGAALLGSVFDEDAMGKLADNRQGGRELARIAAHHPVPEIRITLQVLCAFYARAWALLGPTLQSDLWRELNDLLLDAYRAEIRSLCSHNPHDDMIEVAAATKRLPVEIMFHIALSGDKARNRPTYLKGADLARNIGTVLWLADDLIDLVRDLRCGSVNALLCEARRPLPPQISADDDQVLRCLVDNGSLELSADQLCRILGHVLALLETESPPDQTILDFRQLLLAFVRSWGS